jgi:hypothetical protein
MTKSQNMAVWLSRRMGSAAKWFWPIIFLHSVDGEGHSKALTPANEECNKYDQTGAPCFFIGQL